MDINNIGLILVELVTLFDEITLLTLLSINKKLNTLITKH